MSKTKLGAWWWSRRYNKTYTNLKWYNKIYYIRRKINYGAGIRWILESPKKEPVYCFRCGNFSNAVIQDEIFGVTIHIPVCKEHVIKLMDHFKEPDKVFERVSGSLRYCVKRKKKFLVRLGLVHE